MSELLFEDFWLLLFIAIVVSGGVIYWAMQRRTPRLIKAAKIVPVIFAFLLGLNLWVVTEREAIRDRLDELIQACERGDTNTIGAMLDDQFTAQGMTGEDLVVKLKDVFERLKVPNVTLLDIENKPPRISISTSADIVSESGHDYGRVFSNWELVFIKRSTGWYLAELRPLSVQFKPVQNIHDVLDSARWVN